MFGIALVNCFLLWENNFKKETVETGKKKKKKNKQGLDNF